MNRISKKSPSSTTPASPKRPQSIYQLAAAAVKAAAKEHDLTLSGWLKSHPSDPCRKTKLTDASGTFVGYGYCTPGGSWWLARGNYSHGPIIAEGKVEENNAPVTPEHTVLMTAVIGNPSTSQKCQNRHEKALVVSGVAA